MKHETKEEALKNWYAWLERRLYPKPVSSNQFYIKQAMEGLYHSATSKLIQVKEKCARCKSEHILYPEGKEETGYCQNCYNHIEPNRDSFEEENAQRWADIYCHYASNAKSGESFYQYVFDNYIAPEKKN